MRMPMLCLLLMSCATPRAASEPCAAPVPDDDWEVGDPEADFDGAALCSALESISNSKDDVHAVLIERHGKLIAELYRAGPDSPYDVDYGASLTDVVFDRESLHDVRSISKTVTGLLAGIAQARGQFPALDASVTDELNRAGCSDGVRAVTVENVLTMRTGLEWHEWDTGFPNDETGLVTIDDVAHHVLERKVVAPAGTTFNYNGGNTAVVRLLIERGTGKPLETFAQEALFEPLHIQRWAWVKDAHGNAVANAGLRLRPRDLLKFGRLLLDGGRWRGKQVVPEAWVTASSEMAFATDVPRFSIGEETASYGRQLWTGTFAWRGQELRWVQGIGNGGQRLLVVPALDLVVVMTGGDYGAPRIFDAERPFVNAVLEALR